MKEDEKGGACSTHWDTRNAYRIVVGTPEEKRLSGRPRCRNRVWTGFSWFRMEISGGFL
jgi:hypothetical protein